MTGEGEAIFKVETGVGMNNMMAQMFISKREAKDARNICGSTSRVRRGPCHRRGESGVTTHDWSAEFHMWRRLTYDESRLVGSWVRASNMVDANGNGRARP